jgi:opacity protein-like surface antigen
MKKVSLGSVLLVCASSAAAVSPFVQGGLADIAPGNWTIITPRQENLFPADYGYTFYLGGGMTYDVVRFRQKNVVPTLSLDTDAGITRFHREWRITQLEGWEQTFFEFAAFETFMLRLKVPAGSRLITPYVGVGGGFAVIPTSIDRLEGFPGSREESIYEDSVTAFKPVYAVPFGLEITLSPSSTIFWRFGPVAPVGKAAYEYENSQGQTEKVEAEIPNSFLVTFGFRWGD